MTQITSNELAFVLGTSRSDGNTRRLLNHVNARLGAPIFDLAALNMSYFDYEARNLDDDFIPTIEALRDVSSIGFVSPMYWYTVSAQMKVFIDRLSDLLGPRKDLGGALRGKRTFLIATGNTETQLNAGMEEVVRRTSDYLGMQYQGAFYAHIKEDLVIEAQILQNANSFMEMVLHGTSQAQ